MLLRDTNDGSPYVIRTRVLSVDRRTTLVLYPNPAAYAYAKQRFGALQGSKWGEMEVHLRFCLNTKPMALMRATCHAWAAALPPPSEPDTPALLPALLPLESDLPPPPPPRDAAIVASSYAAAAATSNGGVGSKEFAELATLVPSDLAPLQPQLNDEQMGAVGAITAHAHGALPYVVYGPPGTGKTMTMIEAIMQVLLHHPAPRILVCAPSNPATDTLAERLVAMRDAFNRRHADMVAAKWMKENHVSKFHGTNEQLCQRMIPEYWDINTSTLLRLNAQTRGVDFIKGELLKYCAIDRATGLFKIPDHERLCGARIIFCTCATAHLLVEAGIPSVHAPEGVGAGGAPYTADVADTATSGRRHFTHIFVDEASQALEPEILLPLSLAGVIDDGGASDGGPLAAPLKRAEATCGRCTNVVLCGDHMQLGPMVRSPFCRSHGLGASLLERLMALPLYSQASSRVCTRLVRNYRSHEFLLELPSKLYYDESLKAHADAKRAKALEQWEELPTKGCPLLFFGVVGQLSFEAGSTSYWNDVEASKVASLIQQLVRVDEHGRPIGGGERTSGEGGDGAAAAGEGEGEGGGGGGDGDGATPSLKTSDVAVVTLFRKQVLKIRQLLRKIGLGAVRVGTVDDYQGQEEKVVIISTVLSHSHPHAPALFSSREAVQRRDHARDGAAHRRRQPLGSLRRQDVAPAAEVCHRQGRVPRLRPPAVHGGRRGHRR